MSKPHIHARKLNKRMTKVRPKSKHKKDSRVNKVEELFTTLTTPQLLLL